MPSNLGQNLEPRELRSFAPLRITKAPQLRINDEELRPGVILVPRIAIECALCCGPV